MTNRPKEIGTAAETAVVRAARRLGFPNADRLTLTGNKDRGDIGLCPGVILEVKGGEAAKKSTDDDISRWLAETNREALNAHAEVAFLVTQRRGVGAPNAHRWWAWWRLAWLETVLPIDHQWDTAATIPIRMQLTDALCLLRAAGYGDPETGPLIELAQQQEPQTDHRQTNQHSEHAIPQTHEPHLLPHSPEDASDHRHDPMRPPAEVAPHG